MSSAAVFGIDLGCWDLHVAEVVKGGAETIVNEFSQRSSPALVSLPNNDDDSKFGRREMGLSAQNHQITGYGSAFGSVKDLLGKSGEDVSEIHSEISKLSALSSNKVGIDLIENGQKKSFHSEQIAAMLLTYLKKVMKSANENALSSTSNAVISIPNYWTDSERRSLLDAAQIAGLNSVQLLEDTTALALNYGLFKKDIPGNASKKVIFIDFGYSSLQMTLVEFTNGGFKIIHKDSTNKVSGRAFDHVLVQHFAKEFQEKVNLDVLNNKKASLKLSREVEKVKKQMSANKDKIPMKVECLLDEKDLDSSISRREFEQLSQNILLDIESVFKKFLEESGVELSELNSVEIVGGSSRIPAFKELIGNVFEKAPSTSMNTDEAVAKGCALYGALKSRLFKTRKYEIVDCTAHQLNLKYSLNNAAKEEVLFLKHYPLTSFHKSITIPKPDNNTIALEYKNIEHIKNKFVALYTLKVDEKEKYENVSMDFCLDENGLLCLKQVHGVKKVETPSNFEDSVNTKNEESTEKFMEVEEKIEFDEITLGGLPKEKLEEFINLEKAMIENDLKEEVRLEMKNKLEETIYSNKELLNNEADTEMQNEEAWKIMLDQLDQLSEWIYEEGEVEKEVYEEKLKEMQGKMAVFQIWKKKYSEKREQQEFMRRREEEKKEMRRRQEEEREKHAAHDEQYFNSEDDPRSSNNRNRWHHNNGYHDYYPFVPFDTSSSHSHSSPRQPFNNRSRFENDNDGHWYAAPRQNPFASTRRRQRDFYEDSPFFFW